MAYVPPPPSPTPDDWLATPDPLWMEVVKLDVGIFLMVVVLCFGLWLIVQWEWKQKELCICHHRQKRHKLGKCGDCKCKEYISDWRSQV